MALLALWERWSVRPLGKALFSRAVGFKAPSFATIGARFEELRSGYARVSPRKEKTA